MKAKQFRTLAAEKCKPYSGLLALIMLIFEVILCAAGSLMGVVLLLVGGPLALGWAIICKKADEGEKINVEDLFAGFSNYAASTILYILEEIFIFLWSLLFVIPGIIKSLSYSMSFYILLDNPNMTSTECITKSREMMNGHKWELFCLLFSYIGWFILCALTLGILYFWVGPKVEVAKYEFYKSIK